MKKLIILLGVFYQLSISSAVCAVPRAIPVITPKSTHTSSYSRREKEPASYRGIDGLIGKEIEGCKIVTAYLDTRNSVIIVVCIKNNKLFFTKSEYIEELEPLKCADFICKTPGEIHIPELLMEVIRDGNQYNIF